MAYGSQYEKYKLKNGMYYIDGTKYKFDKNGYCVGSNCSKLVGGKYKFDENGNCTGSNCSTLGYDYRAFYADGTDSRWSTPTGLWESVSNCYLVGGYAVSGLNKIENKWYYLTYNKTTKKCSSYPYKWQCNKKKKTYWYGYNTKRYLKNGSYNIDGTTYKFDKNGYCTGSNCKNNTCK